MRIVRLTSQGAARVAAGYPCVLADWVGRGDLRGRPGELAHLVDSRGVFLAAAYAEADDEIAFRVYSRHEGQRLDEEMLIGLFSRAATLRRGFIDTAATDAYRLFNAEGDGLPGLAVDVYGPYLMVLLYSPGLAAHAQAIESALQALLDPRGVFRTDRSSGPQASRSEEARGRRVRGESPPDGLQVKEAGVRFVVDMSGGYNTGLFLDNRENRLALRAHSRGRRVLNLFSYTGSISVHCALAGAAQVTSVDISERVQQWARANLQANGLCADDHPTVRADALEYLRKGAHRGAQYDLVVLDPPSFSTSKKNVFSTAKDYPSLVAMALDVLAPGGVLAACSNHRKTTADRFLAELAGISRRKDRPLKLLELRGAGPDFPLDLAYPEAAYLKFAVLAG